MQQANIINMNHNRSTTLERSIKMTWGLKPVLRDPILALGFCHGSKHTVVRSTWMFSNLSMDHHGNKSQINTMMKQRWGLDRNNVLRPTPGDPRGVEQHHWKTGAKENQQLNPGGPINRQKSSGLRSAWASAQSNQSLRCPHEESLGP